MKPCRPVLGLAALAPFLSRLAPGLMAGFASGAPRHVLAAAPPSLREGFRNSREVVVD